MCSISTLAYEANDRVAGLKRLHHFQRINKHRMCVKLELQGAIFASQVTFCILKTVTLCYAKELKSTAT